MRDDLVCYIPQHVEYLAYVCFFLLFILSSLSWLVNGTIQIFVEEY